MAQTDLDKILERFERHVDTKLDSLKDWLEHNVPGLHEYNQLNARIDQLSELLHQTSGKSFGGSEHSLAQPGLERKLSSSNDNVQRKFSSNLSDTSQGTPKFSRASSRRGSLCMSSSSNALQMIADCNVDGESQSYWQVQQMHPWWSEIFHKTDGRPSGQSEDLSLSRLRSSGALELLQVQHESDTEASPLVQVLMKFIANPSSAWRLAWGCIGVLFIMYDLIAIPLFLAFNLSETDIVFALGLLITIYWTIDMVMSFFIGYWRHGSLEMHPRRVAMNYLRTWFALDVAIVSLDWAIIIYIGAHGQPEQSVRLGRTLRGWRFIRALRLLRSLRSFKLLRFTEELRAYCSSEYIHIWLDIIKNILAILFLNHVVACIWFGIGVEPGEGGWVAHHELLEEDPQYQYASSLHWSLTQFTQASMEIYPQNFQERIFAMSASVIALIVFSSFLASIVTAMVRRQKLDGDWQTQSWLLRRYLKEQAVSPALSVRIQRYVEFKTSRAQRLNDPKNIKLLKELSEPLKKELAVEKIWPLLKKHPFFMRYGAQDTHAAGDICQNSIISKFFYTNDLVFSEGAACEGMFFIMHGVFEFSISLSLASRIGGKLMLHKLSKRKGRDPQAGLAIELHAGEWCCETALWAPWVHTGTMTSASMGEVALLDATRFKSTCLRYQAVSSITAFYAASFVNDLKGLKTERFKFSGQLKNEHCHVITDLAEDYAHTEKRAALAFGEIEILDQMQTQALSDYRSAIEDRDVKRFHESEKRCSSLEVPSEEMERVAEKQKDESESAGVCLAYILSDEFHQRATNATGLSDPSFLEMRDPFFITGGPKNKLIGEGMLCPRDLKGGCAFIDTLPAWNRQKANVFLSWVWSYKLSIVHSALFRWAHANNLKHNAMFLYMCFFCNNQWRIMVEKSKNGSDNLETVFEERLVRTGRMVALLDNWQDSVYIGRIWTIYEQYVAAKVGVDMEFTLPEHPSTTLIQQLETGKDGITHVIEAISTVDAEHAKATLEEDEHKVKKLIRESIGFATVNKWVQKSITGWIAGEFKANIDRLVQLANQEPKTPLLKNVCMFHRPLPPSSSITADVAQEPKTLPLKRFNDGCKELKGL